MVTNFKQLANKTKEEKSSISNTIWGTDITKQSFKTINITNIGIIFEGLCGKNKVFKGFWKSSISGDKKVLNIQVKPGNNIIDAMRIIYDLDFNKINFLGFAGGLNSSFNIGDHINLEFNKEFQYKIKEVDGLIQEKKYYEDLKSQGYDLVDMESQMFKSFILQKKKIIHIEYNYYVIVSDLPLKKPFYQLNTKDYNTIDKSIKKLVRLVSQSNKSH